VDESNWENWFCPEEKVLLIKDQKNQLEIKLGMRLVEERPPTLTWDIYDVTTNSHHHPHLFFFLREYAHWTRTNEPQWEAKFITKLQQMLPNIPFIFLLLALRNEVRGREGEADKETLKLTPSKNANLSFTWKVDFFELLEHPKIKFFVNESLVL
jgi:hypothetical protein